MRKLAPSTLLLLLAASPVAHASTSCREFLAMPEKEQLVFIDGLVDGMGTTFGVMDTFARHLKAAATSQDEQNGIEKMHGIPQGYMSKGCCLSNTVVAQKIVDGCKAKPDLPAGNMLTDVMSGDL